MYKKLASLTLAGSLIVGMAVPAQLALAATTNPNPVETGRTEMNLKTGGIQPDRTITSSRTLTGSVLIDGPQLVMNVKSNGQPVPKAIITTFKIADKLFGYSIQVPTDGTYTLEARTIYSNGKHAGQTHTNATPVTVTADTTAPIITIGNYITSPTNKPITVNASTNEGTLNASSHTFTNNGSFEFVATDAAGNTSKQTIVISNIDTTAPTAEVSYSTTSLVNTDVIATIKPSESVTVLNNGGSTAYTFTANGSFTFEFQDEAGNVGTVVATVNNIDKTSPVGSVTYSTTAPTKDDVTVTIKFSKPNVSVTNNNGSTAYRFSENGSFIFHYRDAAGNTGSTEVSVSNIDRTPPTGTIQYSTTKATNGDVVVTLQPSEDVEITNNEGQNQYTFTENGEFTFQFTDAAGNTGSAKAEVTNIDKVAPTGKVSYNVETLTNGDVVATLTPSESITVTNHDSLSYTFKENGTFTFEFVDEAGNTGSATATVKNIDKEAPTATVSYSTTELTNEDVVATITTSEPVTITSEGGTTSWTFTENGSHTFEFVDAAGNKGSFTAVVENIDKVAPTANVSYSTTSPVNTDVVVSLTNMSESITVTNNGGSTSYIFTENGSFEFEFVDAAGNKGAALATVNNIDRSSPIGSINYSTLAPTNGDVEVTLSFNKPNVKVTQPSSGSATYTFTDNGQYTFEYVDEAGNVGSTEVSVSNIDRTAPTAEVSYSATTPTNGDVVATITPSETVTILNNDGSTSYTFTANGSFTFVFVDAAGNEGTKVVSVNNIDKTAPTATVAYSTTAATNGNVIVTLSPSETVTVTNNEGLLTRTFTENGSYTFTFVDAAGNTGSVTAAVANIDKTAPVVSGVTNGQTYTAAVAPTFNEGTATLNGQPYVSGTTISTNGSYTLVVTDEAGNKTTVAFTLQIIVKVESVIFASFELREQGGNQFKVYATYTIQYSNGTSKTVTNTALDGGNIANPATQNNNASTKDYSFEGTVYTITVQYNPTTKQHTVTAVKK